MHRRLSLLAPAIAALFAMVVAVAVAADPPLANTQPAKDVGQAQATLLAQVDPQGSATSVQFELGTTTSYGLQSAAKDAGSGTGSVTVEIPVQGLTPATLYHYRVVATSAGGTTRGLDRTFTTTAPPSVAIAGARDVSPAAARLPGVVDPNGSSTQYFFEYGTTTAYGATTPATDAGAGTARVAVSASVEGLQPTTTYHYRLIATNALGTTRSGDGSFTTVGTPTSATLAADRDPVPYGQGVVVSGKLAGSRIAGVPVGLQITPFPFSSPFADTLRPISSSSSGGYSFSLPPITTTTRALVTAVGTPSVLSPMIVLRSAARTGITSVRRAGRQVIVTGRLTPATPAGVAALQRQGADGRWLPLRHVGTGADGRYSIALRSRRQTMLVRVMGLPHDGGAHVRGISRTVMIAGRP